MVSSNELIIYSDAVESHDISVVGCKAEGISNLPRDWVPCFFILSSKLSSIWNAKSLVVKNHTVKCEQILTEDEKRSISDAVEDLGIPAGGQVIVRSSAAEEGIELRGFLLSQITEASLKGILASCDDIFQHASSQKRLNSLNLALIVQTYIKPKASGHLSNERRVAKRRQEWAYEFDYREQRSPIGRFALKYGRKGTARANTGQINALNARELVRQLRAVAAYIDAAGLRLHMEWTWDGKRLWIVQGDRDLEFRGPNPRSYLSAISSSQRTTALKSFVSATSISHDRWHKLQCPEEFKRVGLPTADLWILEDVSILSNLQHDSITQELRQDVETLLSSPIVIRMDIASYDTMPPEMLPRSDCITAPEQAERFLIKQSRNMLSKGMAPEDFCFLVHHYIPSRSSAFCLAYPNRSRVRIDSIWGLPDGLLFYPHDSFEFNPNDLRTMKKHIRFKDNFLAPAPDGEWFPVRAGKPWDWVASVKEEELVIMGKESQRLANHLNDCVQIMWFIDILIGSGLPPLLPWWYTTGEPPAGVQEADPRIFSRNRIFVSTEEDVKRIPVGSNIDSESVVLRLTPRPELLRNGEFLRLVASKAKENNLAMELEGSILQHAYYQLKQLGVNVQCVDFFTPVFPTQQFGKLVRDKIPLRIQSGGERAYSIVLTGEDLIKVLKAKVIEEALELQATTNIADIEEEIGDIWEVILSLAERVGISSKELSKKVEHKRNERGGFLEGLLLIETKEVPLIDINKSTSQLVSRAGKVRLPLLDAEGGVARITTRRVPHCRNGEIIIPLVPPDIPEAAIKLDESGTMVKIRYEDKEIVLRWRREPIQAPREQLRLPGF